MISASLFNATVTIILVFYKITNTCIIHTFINLLLPYFITPLHLWIVGKWLACQSMDNKIIIFNVLNRFKYMRKKTFTGHMVSILISVKHSIVRSD